MNSAKDYILQIIKEYRRAKDLEFPNEKIVRGRSRSVSALAEDLLANLLIQNDNSIEKIFIDLPITTSNKKTIYPDLTIIKNEEVIAMIDLKMDMGWGRNEILAVCEKHSNSLQDVRGTEATYKKDKKTKSSIKFSQKAIYSLVIINTRNSGVNLPEYIQQSGKKYKEINILVLCKSEKYHTNDDRGLDEKELLEKLDVDKPGFKKLLDTLHVQ